MPDSLAEAYPRYEHLLAATQLSLAMFGMGALLAPRDFALVFRKPRALTLGLAIQLGAVPAVAAALGWLLPVEAGVAAGLVLVASVPGGTISNVITYLGRGHIALSISLTAVTTVGALATTPLLLRVWLGNSVPEFEMPVGAVAREIAVTLLLPLAAGMLFGARFPRYQQLVSSWAIRASVFCILLIAVGAGGSGRIDPRSFGVWGLLAQLGFAVAVQALAWAGSRAARLPADEHLALVIEVTVRNTNLAVMVKALLFPAVAGRADPIGDGMLFVAVLYGAFGLLLATPVVLWNRRRTPLVPVAAAAPS